MRKKSIWILAALTLILSGCTKPVCRECKMTTEQLKATDAVFKDLNQKTFTLYQKGDLKEASVAGNKALDYARSTFGSDSPKTATALNNLGELHRLQGKFSDAEGCYLKAISIREKVLGKNNVQVALSKNNLASVYFAQKKFAQAEELYKQSVDILTFALKEGDPNIIVMKRNLAEVYKVDKKYSKAEAIYKEFITEHDKKKDKKDDVDYAKSLNDLAAIYYLQGKYNECIPLFSNTLAILEKTPGIQAGDLVVVLDNIAQSYNKLGDKIKSQAFSDKANALRTKKS